MRQERWVELDMFKRKYFLKFEIKYQIFFIFFKNNRVPHLIKYLLFYKKTYKKRWTNKSQHVNRCTISGRHWYTNKRTRYTRFVFRRESYYGNLPGLKRASW